MMEEKKDSNKKKRSYKMVYLFLSFLIVLGLFLCYIKYFDSVYFVDFFGKQIVDIPNVEGSSISDVNESEINYLKSFLVRLEKSNEDLRNSVDDIKGRLDNASVDNNRRQVLRIALDIQNNIRNFKNYEQNLNSLKFFSLPKLIKDEVAFLYSKRNHDVTEEKINNDFKKELDLFLDKENSLKSNENRFVRFLSNFVIVRDKSANFVVELQNSINRGNYELAHHFLESNSEYFKETLDNIILYNSLNKSIDNIIIYLIGGNND